MFKILLFFLSLNLLFGGDFKQLCDRLKSGDERLFLNREFFYDLVDSDFACEDEFMRPFFDIAILIRGINVDCEGQKAIDDLQNFKFQISKAMFAPRLFAQNLPDTNASEVALQKSRDGLKFWAYKSLSSFELYNKFNEIYKESVPNLVQFYKNFHKFNDDEAIFFANKTANEFLKFITQNYKGNLRLSKLESFVANKNLTPNALAEFLYSQNFTLADLTNALNIALLENLDDEIVKILIARGANVNSGNESAIFSALRNKNKVKLLLLNGAQVNYKNSFGKTPIFYAVEFDDYAMSELLASNGADLNAKYISNHEKTALLGSNSFPFYVKFCGINHTSRTLLMHAAQKSSLKIVKFLIANGVDLSASDDLGYNALDYAILGGRDENAQYLRKLGLKATDFNAFGAFERE